jgi:hypothetical protein
VDTYRPCEQNCNRLAAFKNATVRERPQPVIERYENRTFNFGKQLRARRTALE